MLRFCLWFVAVIVVFLSPRILYDIYNFNYSQTTMSLLAIEFEVFGKVQGVFFRKNTNEKALRKGENHRYGLRPFTLTFTNISAQKINPLLQLRVTGLGEEYQVR